MIAKRWSLMHPHSLPLGLEGVRSRSLRPSCDAEFARALKVFYHSMTSVRGQLQRLRRHRPSVCIYGLLLPTRRCNITDKESSWNCNI